MRQHYIEGKGDRVVRQSHHDAQAEQHEKSVQHREIAYCSIKLCPLIRKSTPGWMAGFDSFNCFALRRYRDIAPCLQSYPN